MQSKSPLSQRPDKLPVYDSSGRRVMVDAKDYPACLYLPVFPPARGLTLTPWQPIELLPFFIHYLRDTVNEVRQKYSVNSISPPYLMTHHFFRLLAKIAHGFAFIKFGFGGITYVLRPLIFSREEDPLWFIGCDAPEPPTDQLHQLHLQYRELGGGVIITVRIRLFARYGAPTYRSYRGLAKFRHSSARTTVFTNR